MLSGSTVLRNEMEQHIEALPVLRIVVANLMTLDRSDEHYFENIVRLIGSDPTFTARLLAVANSAESAPRSPVTTLAAAISRIGTMNASNIILAVGVADVFVPRDPWEKSLWRHALQVAILSRSMAIKAQNADLDPDEVYTCALLHDVGRFVMFRVAPEELRSMDEGDWQTPEALVAKEIAFCGMSHAELGERACRSWKLPTTIIEVVRDHHKSASVLSSMRVGRVTALIRFADLAMFPSTMPGTPGLAEADDATIEAVVTAAMPSFLRLTSTQLRETLIDAEAEAERVCRAIGIN